MDNLTLVFDFSVDAMNECKYRQLPGCFLAICLLGAIVCFFRPSGLEAATSVLSEEALLGLSSVSLPSGMLELMRASRAKYLEGSDLIKLGDSERARESFNKAVDMILQSKWDVASNPVLNRFFQDLIERIQDDESHYLMVPYDASADEESAVVDELQDLDLIPISVDPALQDALALELSNTKFEIPITINEMVMKSLNFWLNRGRKYFEEGLMRSGQYRPMIERIFREESIPLDLMYLTQVESLFKTNAVSRAKAKGIWQFGRETAIRYGLKVNKEIDERSDPEKSTRAAARYLNDLFAMFQNWDLVMAAYNWGEGNIKRLVEKTGISDFWKLIDLKSRIPKETKNHVPLIHASVILARNPDKYGLPTELHPPLQYTEVSVSKPIDLRAAAEVLNISLDQLKKLNPELRGMTTPANYPDYRLKVPPDIDPQVAEQLAALPRAKIQTVAEHAGRHRVRPGESLSKIAARYRVSVADLVRANNLSIDKKLLVGMWLDIPSHGTSAKRTSPSRRAASNEKSPVKTSRQQQARKVNKASSDKPSSGSTAKTAAKAAPEQKVRSAGSRQVKKGPVTQRLASR